MSMPDLAGQSLFQLHDANRMIAETIAAAFRRRTPVVAQSDSLSGPRLLDQEPGLRQEAGMAARHG